MNRKLTALTLAILIILIAAPSFLCGMFYVNTKNGNNQIQNTTVIIGQQEKESKVNINTATIDELKTLPGIGDKKAFLIAQKRKYNDIYDLLTNDILGEDVFNDIKDKITI